MANKDVIDIELKSPTKRFRINGDDDCIIELNTGDMNIVKRIEEFYPKLMELNEQINELSTSINNNGDDNDNMQFMEDFSSKITELDTQMRGLVNKLFNSDVCSVCASNGTMYDIVDGELRYNHIIITLIGLYEDNISKEAALRKKKIQSHTDKYTSKRAQK